jgi:predicted transcriptional regulator of viral defense system
MNFQQFRSAFQSYPIISRIEIEKVYPGFDPKNLVHWQKKQYLQRIRNSWYRLKETPLDSDTLFFISNQIYQPSYISLETAMSHYGFIPEGVFKVTSVSTLKTNDFQTAIGNFGYQNIKPSLYLVTSWCLLEIFISKLQRRKKRYWISCICIRKWWMKAIFTKCD